MKILKVIALVFSIIGIGMLVGSYFVYNNINQFVQTAVITTGKVIDLTWSRSTSSSGSSSGVYYPVVRFETDRGQTIEFKGSTGSSPPSYKVGQDIKVIYSPKDPYRPEIDSLFSIWFGFIILCGLGVIFSGIGLTVFGVQFYTKQKNEWLQQNGRRLVTEYQGVALNTSESVNGNHPYQIISQWLNPETNEIHVFKSQNIMFNPESYIADKKITVYVDPQNLRRFYMDTAFLPRFAD